MSQKKPLRYEESVNRLEEIAGELENGDLPLDEAVKRFEESVTLASFCKNYLENLKGKVTELTGEETDGEQDNV